MTRVLCVEDESDFREDIAAYLRMQAYEVDEAADGASALHMLQSNPYDLVVCDILMPGMDGFSLLQEYRNQSPEQSGAEIPFVFLTALSNVHDQITARNLGCDDFLAKPIDFKLLTATIENRIAHYAHARVTREMAQLESVTALQAVYAHELMQPAIQLYEVAQYISNLRRDEHMLDKLDAFLPKMQQLARRQLRSIEVLREIENLQHEPAPQQMVSLNDQWLAETARYISQRLVDVTVQQQHLVQEPHKVVAEPAWIFRAMMYLAESVHKVNPKQILQCRVDSANAQVQVHIIRDGAAREHLSSTMTLQGCLTDAHWKRALSTHWGAMHYADAVMRKQSGTCHFQLSSAGLASVTLGLPAVKLH